MRFLTIVCSKCWTQKNCDQSRTDKRTATQQMMIDDVRIRHLAQKFLIFVSVCVWLCVAISSSWTYSVLRSQKIRFQKIFFWPKMESLLKAWNPSWAEMPWKSFTCPAERFKVQFLLQCVITNFQLRIINWRTT